MHRIAVFLLTILLSPAAWCLSLTVHINGVNPDMRDHIAAYLDISQIQGITNVSQERLERFHDRAVRQIKTALQVYGYYDARVKADLRHEAPDWIATYTIELGEPIKINSIDLVISGEGQDNPAIKTALEKFPIHKGDVLEDPKYDAARDALFRTCIQQGYLDTQFEKREVRVDLPSYSASISLHLQTGHRYYFGDVTFKQDVMNPTFMRTFIRFKSGDPYSPGKLLQLQSNLNDSGLFKTVEVLGSKANAQDYHVPITITLTGRKRNLWRFGLGYATDTGARFSTDYTHIVGKEGHKFTTGLLLSETTKSFSVGYQIPLQDPVTQKFGLGAKYSDELIEGRRSVIDGWTVNHTSPWHDWVRVISFNYDNEVYTINDEPEQSGRALYPLISITRISADNRINTRNGYRIYLEVRGANKNLFSDTNYGQFRASGKWIHAVADDTRLLLRSDLGSTNVANLDSMPLSQRFFAGGDNSVRGYAYQELGPKDAYGNVAGGKYLIVGSVEVDQLLVSNWSGAVFYDIGNAINSISDPLAKGAGFGVRWISPVGPIRLDFAWGLSKEQGRFRLHLVIGPDL